MRPEKKSLPYVSWKFVTGGFVAPSSHAIHGGVFMVIMFVAGAIASKAARTLATRS
jgi:hypothetical protein